MGGRETWVFARKAAAVWPRRADGSVRLQTGSRCESAEELQHLDHCWRRTATHTIGSSRSTKRERDVDAKCIHRQSFRIAEDGAWGIFMPEPTTYEWMLKHKRGSKGAELPPKVRRKKIDGRLTKPHWRRR
jgi:hypothetical protein